MKVTAKSLKNLQVQINVGKHEFIADEPLGFGDDQGPDPYALLLSSLGACKVMTVLMYARKKGWPVEDVEVNLETFKIHAKDCKDCESNPNARVDIIEVDIRFVGDLSDEQRKRLEEISTHCPVHRTLTSEIKIYTNEDILHA